ncbi:DUF7565 family protein [Halospeciosus flavus]|uniref:C2H2-type domain-containing protein n=1 Tax=Halospeciosus flavus TaxID=3032283 RepID=A0ABD5Z5F2_9EURY|nr:hypothetical protein [Halospeciosus flavus]
MSGWECAVAACGSTFGRAEELVAHQVNEHERHECRVCGTVVPEGFFAIQHVFDTHSRAQYVRAYDADADDIRVREEVKHEISDVIDIASLREQLGIGVDEPTDADE